MVFKRSGCLVLDRHQTSVRHTQPTMLLLFTIALHTLLPSYCQFTLQMIEATTSSMASKTKGLSIGRVNGCLAKRCSSLGFKGTRCLGSLGLGSLDGTTLVTKLCTLFL
jgi:hypothetical protein